MTETPQQPEGNEPEGGEKPEQTFTQADVDRIVKERVQRERAKFSDYDALKASAGEKATLEERVAAIEDRAVKAEARALRAEIANAHGIAADDRDLFLTGTDEETLTAQAKRLAERESQRKKNGNHVPREGNNPKSENNDPMREFTRGLFSRANAD